MTKYTYIDDNGNKTIINFFSDCRVSNEETRIYESISNIPILHNQKGGNK